MAWPVPDMANWRNKAKLKMWKVCSTIEGKQAAQRDDGNWSREYKVSRLYMNLRAPVIKWFLND
jgi:hypothetical protein